VHIYARTKAKWLKVPKRTPSFRDYYKTRELWPEASLKRLYAALGSKGRSASPKTIAKTIRRRRR
jgi:hypothetical protein